MSAAHYEAIDRVLLLLSESRQRAEEAAKSIGSDEGPVHLVAALESADKELLALHRRLLDSAYFHSPSANKQLRLSQS